MAGPRVVKWIGDCFTVNSIFFTPGLVWSMACSTRCQANWAHKPLTLVRISHGEPVVHGPRTDARWQAWGIAARKSYASSAFVVCASGRDSAGGVEPKDLRGSSIKVGADELALEKPPWMFGFQCNERYLDWDASAQRQLLKIVAADKLGVSEEELGERINQVGTLVPDLVGRLDVIRADLLVKLLEDVGMLSEKLVVLRNALPEVDISSLVAQFPYLVADNSAIEIQDRIDEMKEMLPGVDISALLMKEPRLFDADLKFVLEDIQRLMGKDTDPVALLVARPEMVLSMEQSGLTSAIDIERP